MEKLRIAFQAWSNNIRQKKEQEEKRITEEQVAKARYWKIPICNDDDEDDTIAIAPVLPTVEPDNSLSMGDVHLSTIPEKEESSVEDLVPILSESEGISDSMCDVPFCDNSTPLEASKDHSEILLDSNDDYSSSDDDSLYSENIDYVDASPPDFELVSLEEIEALKDNPTPSSEFVTKSPSTSPNSFLEETNIFYNSLPETETFCFNLEEKSSGNPTSYTNLSLPDYEAFFYDSEPDSGDFTIDVVEDIFDNPTREPRVHVPNVLPTHPTLHLDYRILFDTLLLFLSENEDNVFPILDCPDFEASRARGFVLRSLELQSSASFGNPISNLID
ncbi:hypothetical protein Tco_1531615 [Tanacetum coccineum]